MFKKARKIRHCEGGEVGRDRGPSTVDPGSISSSSSGARSAILTGPGWANGGGGWGGWGGWGGGVGGGGGGSALMSDFYEPRPSTSYNAAAAAAAAAARAASSSASSSSAVGLEQPRKRWCFTVNNPTAEEAERVRQTLTAESCQFAKVGWERSEAGTRHLQGFVNLRTKKRMTTLKRLVAPRGHFEVARGTDQENDDYCGKGGDILLEVGAPQRQGRRNDLSGAVAMLRESHGDLHTLADEVPGLFVRHGRGLANWVDFARVARERDFKTRVTVLVGPPGCGKRRRAHAAAVANETGGYFYKTRGEWWDGYNGQAVVIIDDFYGWLKHEVLLQVCDRYPLRVPVKGAFVSFVAEEVYITSNCHLWDWYTFHRFDATALMRRVDSYLVWDADAGRFRQLRDCPRITDLRYGY